MWPFVIMLALAGQAPEDPCVSPKEWDNGVPACPAGTWLSYREDNRGDEIALIPWCCPVEMTVDWDNDATDRAVPSEPSIRIDVDSDNTGIWQVKTLGDWICVKREE